MPINEPCDSPRFDESSFGFLVLGTGELFSARFYHTSLLLIAGSQRIQVDVPSPYFKMLAEATKKVGLSLKADDIDDYIVTHVHGDHCNGCEALGFHKRFIQDSTPRLYALPEVIASLWDGKLRASMGQLADKSLNPLPTPTIESFFEPHPISPESETRIGEVTMTVRRTLHAVPCIAVKFEWRGRRLGYSCDTLYDPALIAWLSECDLIFHETTVGPHTPYECLTALDDSLRAKMVLIHLSDSFVCVDSLLRPAEQGAFYPVA